MSGPVTLRVPGNSFIAKSFEHIARVPPDRIEIFRRKPFDRGRIHVSDVLRYGVIEVADIYDALTAQDRPYKPAMPHEKARKILVGDAEAGKLDKSLVALFFERDLHDIELTGDTQVLTQVG